MNLKAWFACVIKADANTSRRISPDPLNEGRVQPKLMQDPDGLITPLIMAHGTEKGDLPSKHRSMAGEICGCPTEARAIRE